MIDSVPTMNTTIESTPMPSLRKSWIGKTMAPITQSADQGDPPAQPLIPEPGTAP